MTKCRVVKAPSKLEELIDKYGQSKGLKMYLRGDSVIESPSFDTLKADYEIENIKFFYEYYKDSADSKYEELSGMFGKDNVNIVQSKDNRGREVYKVIVVNPLRDKSEEYSVGVSNPFEQMVRYISGQVRIKANRISKLKSELSEAKRSSNKPLVEKIEKDILRISEDITKLKDQITEFETKLNVDSLKDIAMTQLDWARYLLSKESLTPSELIEINYVIDTWSNVRSIMYDETEDVPEDMLKLFGEINNKLQSDDLFGSWYKLSTKFLSNQAKYKSQQELLDEYYKLKDVNFFSSYGLDLSRTGNKLLSSVNENMVNAVNRAELESKELSDEINKRFKILKDKGKDYKILMDNGNLTSRYTSNYWNEKRKVDAKFKASINNATSQSQIKAAYNNRNKWYKDNTVTFDVRYIADNNFVSDQGVTKDMYLSFLATKFDSKMLDDIITKAKESYLKYEADLSYFKQDVMDLIDNSEITQEEGDKKISEWIKQNNPSIFLAQSDPGNNNFIQKYNKYVVTNPVEFSKDGKNNGFYNENFKRIEADESLLSTYNFIKEFMGEMMSYIPRYLTKDNDVYGNFLPRIKKEFIDDLNYKDFWGMVATMKDDFIDGITSEDGLDHRFIQIDPVTGMPYKNIKMAFLSNIPQDERSTNLPEVLKAFSNIAVAYKWKSRVEDQSLLVNRFVSNVVNSQGRKRFTNDELTNIRKMLEYSEDVLLYSKSRVDEGKSNLKIFTNNSFIVKDISDFDKVNNKYNKLLEKMDHNNALNELKDEFKSKIEIVNEKKRYKQLKEVISQIEEDFYLEKITEEEYNNKIQPLEKNANSIGKNLVFSKIGDKLLRYNQALALGFNPFSAVNNYLFGITSNMMWASGRTDFTPREMNRALGLMWKSSLTLKDKQFDKVANLMSKFDILQETIEFKSDSKNSTLKKLKDSPYELLRRGDYFIKGQTFIAMMLNTKIKDLSGNSRSLYDAFDNSGNWKASEFGENKGWNGNISNSEEMQDFLNFKNRSTQLIKKLHGNFDPKSPAMYKKYILGRMLGQFRLSWMAEGFAQRFESKKMDPFLQREIEGRYVTAYRLGIGQTLKTLTKLALRQKDAFNGIKAQDRKLAEENIRKLLIEIYLYAVMLSLYLLAKAGTDDDEDDEAYFAAMNLLNRVMADTTFYLSPNTFTSLIGDPIPVLKVPIRATKAFDSAIELIFNDDLTEYQQDQKFTNITNAFPYINQYNRFQYLTERER